MTESTQPPDLRHQIKRIIYAKTASSHEDAECAADDILALLGPGEGGEKTLEPFPAVPGRECWVLYQGQSNEIPVEVRRGETLGPVIDGEWIRMVEPLPMVGEAKRLTEPGESWQQRSDRFLYKLVAIKTECNHAVGGARRRQFDQGSKWLGLRIQALIREVGDLAPAPKANLRERSEPSPSSNPSHPKPAEGAGYNLAREGKRIADHWITAGDNAAHYRQALTWRNGLKEVSCMLSAAFPAQGPTEEKGAAHG